MNPNTQSDTGTGFTAQQPYFPPPPPQSGAGQAQQLPAWNDYPENVPPPASGPLQSLGGVTDHQPTASPAQTASTQPLTHQEYGPPMPPRPQPPVSAQYSTPPYVSAEYQNQTLQSFAPPPQRQKLDFSSDDPSDPAHYIRDPHRLVAYLIPFPAPQIKGVEAVTVPKRFMIFTPPPPPLVKPKEGEKEAKLHKVQRKWQEEVRAAKTSEAKIASWQGVKSRATKVIDWGVNQTTTSNIDFLGRISDSGTKTGAGNPKADPGEGQSNASETAPNKTVGVEEMVLVYPSSFPLTPDELRAEFINTMLRTKTKAQRDTIIATGLMPVAYGIDILATLVWPFGGLGEIDTVWAYSSFRGAKTARSVTKRLGSSTSASASASSSPALSHGTSGGIEQDQLHLTFTPSPRIELLSQYLTAQCHKASPKYFPTYRSAPTETQILEAIGWSPAHTNGADTNWEDEHWQLTEVKEDVRTTMHKAAKEWEKWCKRFEADPEKALKK